MSPQEIRLARTLLGLTQGAAARLVGVDGRTWRKWENAERGMPEPVVRLLLAVAAVPGLRVWLEELASPTI